MIELPSTSPANAAFSLERLEEIWKQELGNICKSILQYRLTDIKKIKFYIDYTQLYRFIR